MQPSTSSVKNILNVTEGESAKGEGDGVNTCTASHLPPLEPPEEIPKSKRRCLRCDFEHSRDLFITMFYRIWMYRRRHILLTLVQLLVPPLILIGMTFYLGTLLNVEEKGWTHFPRLDEQELLEKICGFACENSKGNASTATGVGVIALYMANNKTLFANHFTRELKSKLSQVQIDLITVTSSDDLLKEAIRYQLRGEIRKFIAGIEINNPADVAHTPVGIGNTSYKIQIDVSLAQKTPGFTFANAPTFFDLEKHDPQLSYQLLGIELVVFRTFYDLIKKNQTGITPSISLGVQSLSYPPHTARTLLSPVVDANAGALDKDEEEDNEVDLEYQGVDPMLSTIFILSMVPMLFTVVEASVTEKENGFKLYLQLMGFPRAAYWFHWILNQLIIQFIVISLQVWLVFFEFDKNVGPLIKYGDPGLWFFVLVLYNMACLSFFTFFASVCRRGTISTYVSSLIWLFTYHMLVSHVFDYDSGFTVFVITCLIPSGCIHWAVYILKASNLITWDVIVEFPLTQHSGFLLWHVMLMMVLNFFGYFLLTLYLDNLNPGPMELGQPWHYFFESCRCRFIDPNKENFDKPSEASSGPGTEASRRKKRNRSPSTASLNNPSIQVKQLSKRFYLIHGVYGIENVHFTAYPGSITVLLGHKDCGKTTTMRLLCGAYAPTAGQIIVFDYNVRKDLQKVQSYLSVCMQNNMLCDYLTCMEHMQLIAKLKGVHAKEAREDAKHILESVGLLPHQNEMLWRLANWQLRVLCVAIALIGEAPIMLLDEPTEGLDNDAKRQIWSVLKDLKVEGKTIVVGTQSIDEANQFADKIVLMSRGKVVGTGAPSKLELLFETGYHLVLDTEPEAKAEDILEFLKQHISKAKIREGALKRMKKVIAVENWEQQNHEEGIRSLLGRKRKSRTVINIPTDIRVSISKPKQSRDSRPSLHGKSHILTIHEKEISFLLPLDERVNFPKLFNALDDGKAAAKYGIKAYHLKLHNVEDGFDELDDYVDVLNSTRSTEDLPLEDFGDSKTSALQVFMEEVTDGPMPPHEFRPGEKTWCSCWLGVWALAIKRLCHAWGNYRHAIVQTITPIIILMITISSTDIHFSPQLLSPKIFYNSSFEPRNPVVPYRNGFSKPAQDFLSSYKTVAGKSPNFIMNFKQLDRSTFMYHYNEDTIHKLHGQVFVAIDLTGLDDNSSTVTALYSPTHHHSAPLSLILMFNSLLHYEFPERNYEVSMSARAMLHKGQFLNFNSKHSAFPRAIEAAGVDITLTVALAFGYFIFTSGFVTQPTAERLSYLKRYQMYNLEWNGLYWITYALVDLVFNIVMTTFMTLVIYYMPEHMVFRNPQFIILFVLTGTLGGFSSIIASYFWSHHWLKKSTAYYVTLCVNQFFGLFLFLFYTIVNFDGWKFAAIVVAFCLEILQPFTVPYNFWISILWALQNARCRALSPLVKEEMCSKDLANVDYIHKIRQECCSEEHEDWSFDFIWNKSNWIITPLWSNIVILIVHCVVGVLVLMYMESRRMRRHVLQHMYSVKQSPAILNPIGQKSILDEEKYVKETIPILDDAIREKLFIVENLSSASGRRNILHPMTWYAEPGKCLVIAGPETSGITVLFKILAGLKAISEGTVTCGGYSLFSWGSRRKFLQQLGLSASEFGCLDNLTGYQLLRLFGQLRRIPHKQLSSHVDYWVKKLGLQTKINKTCSSYSFVYKRKLDIACAVIGNPPVCIFEEPTKDLDPLSRTEVHKVIMSLINAQRVVIILTHDLASLENLYSKLIILVNGQVQFCEKTENIEDEIAEEFTLTVKLKADEDGKIKFTSFAKFVDELESEIESMSLQEEQSHMLIYRIKDLKLSWAKLFETVEKIVNKYEEVILDYNIRRTTIEDVYNSYAAKQRKFRATRSNWEEFLLTYC